MPHDPRDSVDPKAQTAVTAQTPFDTGVTIEDDVEFLPEANVTPLTDDEMLARARAEEDMRRRRDSARLEEERLAATKRPTTVGSPSWPTIPHETTKTYDFSAVKLVEEMRQASGDTDLDELSPDDVVASEGAASPEGESVPPAASPFDVIVPSADVAPPDNGPVGASNASVQPDQAYRSHEKAQAQRTPASAKSARRRSSKERQVRPTMGFADWIHTYRLPIITFLIGVVVGVFIAFSM